MEQFERQFKTPEEEVAYLRGALRRKEQTLSSVEEEPQGSERETTPSEEVVREYASVPTGSVLDGDFEAQAQEVERIVLDLSPEEHDKTVEQYVHLALERGVKHTLEAIRKMGNPHLEDDFHRMLAEYVKEKEVPRATPRNISHALTFTLLEIRVPRSEIETDDAEAHKQTASHMKNMLAGLRDLNKRHGVISFSIEVALEETGSDVRFFVAVPADKQELFEKQLSAVFPRVKVVRAQDDYNIFNSEGESSASIASFRKHEAYPIQTFDAFSNDPLNTLVQAITELKYEGEGASIQFVFSPLPSSHAGAVRELKTKLEQGENAEEVLSTRPRLAQELSNLLFSGNNQQDEEKLQKNKERNAQFVELLDEKLSSDFYAVNIRIVTSAEDHDRADAIRKTIEAAFRQFDRPEGNGLEFNEHRKQALKKTLHQFSFRLFERSSALTLNHGECATLIHIPGPGTHTLASSAPAGQYEGEPPHELPTEGALLGTSSHRGKDRDIYFAPEDRLRHFYCIGQTGTGKSTLLKNMIIQDIQAGDGVCMIDPHGSDIDDVLAAVPEERFDDVIYFDPADTGNPMGLNMLEFDSRFPEQKTFVVNEMLSIFNKLFDMKTAGGPMFEQYFRNAVLLALEGDEPATLFDIPRVLSDVDFRRRKLERSTNPVVVQFWQGIAEKAGGEASLQNIVPYITSKFDAFLSNDILRPIIAQERSAFRFRDVMDNKKILLVNLSKGRLGDINANLIGLIIVGKILLAALSRSESRDADFPPFYLYLDEFQNVTTDSIATILSEARKYKLSLNLAHQFIAQISDPIKDAVFGNVGSLASFRVGTEDAEYLEKLFAPVFSARDIANVENRHAILRLLVNGTPQSAFQIETLPPSEGNEAYVAELKQRSREKYGGDREEIERSLASK